MSPVTIGVMYGTGLLMSLSPCALSLLPLTISYIAGSEAEGAAEEVAEGREKGGFESLKGGFIPSAAFAAGDRCDELAGPHGQSLYAGSFFWTYLCCCTAS